MSKTFWIHCRRDGAVFAYGEKPSRAKMADREIEERVQLSHSRDTVRRAMGLDLKPGSLIECRITLVKP